MIFNFEDDPGKRKFLLFCYYFVVQVELKLHYFSNISTTRSLCIQQQLVAAESKT
jgi:hypothetical protein